MTGNKTCVHCTKVIPNTDLCVTTFRIENDYRVDEKYYCLPCDLELSVRKYEKDGIITSKLYREASNRTGGVPWWAARIVRDMKGIEHLERAWEMAVWFGGKLPKSKTAGSKYYRYQMVDVPTPGSLQEFVCRAVKHGYSATVGDIKYHLYIMCSRPMFQIEQGNYHIKLILNNTSPEPRGGIQGICATAETAEKLFRQAIADWKSGTIKLKQSNVGIL